MLYPAAPGTVFQVTVALLYEFVATPKTLGVPLNWLFLWTKNKDPAATIAIKAKDLNGKDFLLLALLTLLLATIIVLNFFNCLSSADL